MTFFNSELLVCQRVYSTIIPWLSSKKLGLKPHPGDDELLLMLAECWIIRKVYADCHHIRGIHRVISMPRNEGQNMIFATEICCLLLQFPHEIWDMKTWNSSTCSLVVSTDVFHPQMFFNWLKVCLGWDRCAPTKGSQQEMVIYQRTWEFHHQRAARDLRASGFLFTGKLTMNLRGDLTIKQGG